eukprot:1158812-Pelagomonas_calceolata.AAC.6
MSRVIKQPLAILFHSLPTPLFLHCLYRILYTCLKRALDQPSNTALSRSRKSARGAGAWSNNTEWAGLPCKGGEPLMGKSNCQAKIGRLFAQRCNKGRCLSESGMELGMVRCRGEASRHAPLPALPRVQSPGSTNGYHRYFTNGLDEAWNGEMQRKSKQVCTLHSLRSTLQARGVPSWHPSALGEQASTFLYQGQPEVASMQPP